MIDVNQITTTLRGMPDQQLQQYAAMHKGDPYILSLAVAESNQRKQLRTAAQGQAGGMPQPKVADAAIAGMAAQQLPEDQGIAQIPTPNIKHMADGGIAGYGDDENNMAAGGSMFDFAQHSEPVLRMAGGGHVPRYQGNTFDGSVVSSNPMFSVPGFQAVQPRAEFTQQGAPENTPFFQRVFDSLSSGNKERQLAMIEQKIAQGTATPEEKAYYQVEMGKKSGQPQPSAPKDVVNPDEVLMAAEKAKKAGAAAADKAADKNVSAAPAPQSNLSTGLPSLSQAKKMSDELYDTKRMEQMVNQQRLQERQDIQNQTEARAEKMAAFNKEQGPAMAGYEKLLKSEELQDATDKEKSGLMALMKGFLGMAAGESPYAATNIAKGAMAGLSEYNDSLKEFKKAAKERNKAMADIENARRAETRGDFKSQQDYEDKANERLSKVDQHATDAVLGIMGKKGEGAVNIAREMIQQSGANARTNAQINAPGQTERLIDRMARDPKFKEEYKNYASIGPEAKGMEAELQAYIKNPMLLKSTNPELAAQFDAIIKQRMPGLLKPVNVAQGNNLLP
jgi:hypothetical protein